MNKAEVTGILHKAVFNMEEPDSVALPYPEWDAKNLFVRDDKKRNYYLITVKGDKRVDLKAFRKAHGLRALSFASAEELLAMLDLISGAVTPLGLLNDAARSVHFIWMRNSLETKSACIPTTTPRPFGCRRMI